MIQPALCRLASGVCVLTARHQGRMHGTTVSTVTAVSHTPPLLGACLRPGSVLRELAVAEGAFAVSVLSAAQARLARWFADPGRPTGAAQFAKVLWTPARGGAPLLHGAVAQFECRVGGCAQVGDHDVLLGRVLHAVQGTDTPLIGFDGLLHVIGPPPDEATGSPPETGHARLEESRR